MKLWHCLKSQKGTDQISWGKVMVLIFIKGGSVNSKNEI